MSCGSFRTVVNNTTVALQVYCGTEQLHHADRRDCCQVAVAEGLVMLSYML
jgi:hypothetical protein